MHTITLGKRRLAFGLRWEDLEPGRTAAAAFRELAGKSASGLHAVLGHKDGRRVIGYVEPKPKGRFYSAAQALAVNGQDGIYVMTLPDGHLWWVMILEGLVVPSTDHVDTPEAVVVAVNEMRHVADCPLYCTVPDSVWPDAGLFDLESILADIKLKPLLPIGKTAQAGVMLGLLLVAAVAGGAWYVLKPPRVDDAKAQAEQAWEARRLYLDSLRDAVRVPASAGWVVDAWEQAGLAFSPVISGWHLKTVHCETAQCLATYQAPPGEVRATGPVIDTFARIPGTSVQTSPADQDTLAVSLPLTVAMQSWTDDQLLAPLEWPRPAVDVAGRAGLYFAHLSQDGPVTITPVGGERPADASALNEEIIVLQQASVLDTDRLRSLVDWFGQQGFVIRQILITQRTGQMQGTTRIECVRYAGILRSGTLLSGTLHG